MPWAKEPGSPDLDPQEGALTPGNGFTSVAVNVDIPQTKDTAMTLSRRTFGTSLLAGIATAGIMGSTADAKTPGPSGRLAGLVPVATAATRWTEAFRSFGNMGGGWSNKGGWAASDGVYSVELPGRRVAWLMNDTFLGPVNEDESMTEPGFIHGSIVLGGRDGLPDMTITGGTQDEPESIASPPDAVDGDPWYWNGPGILDGGRLRVIQSRTGLTDGEPPWNFGWVGTDIVTYSRDFKVEKVTRTYGEPGQVNWSCDLRRVGGHLYIYGNKDSTMYVARARVGHLIDRDWEFYAGGGWSPDPEAAAAIIDDVGASFSVTPMLGGFVLTTTAADIFSNHQIYVATAPTPWGPFSGRRAVYTAPEGGVGDIYAPYNVAAHPTISRPGELIICYNVNSGNGDDLLADANNNRPRFVKINFER